MSSSGFTFRALISTSRQLQDTTSESRQPQQPTPRKHYHGLWGKKNQQPATASDVLRLSFKPSSHTRLPSPLLTTVSPGPPVACSVLSTSRRSGFAPTEHNAGDGQETSFHLGRARSGERGYRRPPAAALPLRPLLGLPAQLPALLGQHGWSLPRAEEVEQMLQCFLLFLWLSTGSHPALLQTGPGKGPVLCPVLGSPVQER